MRQAKTKEKVASKGVAPTASPIVTPNVSPYDHSFLLQAIMENQRTLGEIKEGLSNIKSTVEAHGKKLDRHNYIIALATGAFIVCAAIGSFMIDKLWDKISSAVQITVPTTQRVSSSHSEVEQQK